MILPRMAEQNAASAHAADGTGEGKKGRFEPKTPVKLDPPKDDPISMEHLEKCDGEPSVFLSPGFKILSFARNCSGNS